MSTASLKTARRWESNKLMLKKLTGISMFAIGLKNRKLFGKIINNLQMVYPFAKCLVFL